MPNDTSEIGKDLVVDLSVSLKAICNIWFCRNIWMYSFEKKIKPNESNIGENQDPLKCPTRLQLDHGNVMEAYCKVKCFKCFNIL